MAKELIEALKKAGNISKDKMVIIEEFLNQKSVTDLLSEGIMLKSGYTQKLGQINKTKEELQNQIQQAVDQQKTQLQQQLEADYKKKAQDLENYQKLLSQQAGQLIQTEQQKAALALQELQRANQDVQRIVSTISGYQDGEVVLRQVGLQQFNGYGQQLLQGQGLQYGTNVGYGQQQGFNNPYAPNPIQYQQNQYGNPYGSMQNPYQQQGQLTQQGFQPNIPAKPPTTEELLAALLPRIQETYSPNLNSLAQLPFEIYHMAAEHQKLTGETLNTTDLYNKAIEAKGAKTPQQIWEETYDIPTKRAEAQQKAEQDRIENLVKQRLDEERAKQSFPSEKPVDLSLKNSNFLHSDPSAEPDPNAEGMSFNEAWNKSYVSEAIANLHQGEQS